MKKVNRLCAILIAALMLLCPLFGCTNSHDSSEVIDYNFDDEKYNEKRLECFLSIRNNQGLLNDIIRDAERYRFDYDICCEDGAIVVYTDTEKQRNRILADEEFTSNLMRLFENECIDCFSKTYDRDGNYFYAVDFVYFIPYSVCYASLDRGGPYNPYSAQHIGGDWYFYEYVLE